MKKQNKGEVSVPGTENLETATFGSGCFWCTEAVFERLDGVHDVVSGYAGGHVADPTYKEVCSGQTGHAEVVQILFDPGMISYEELLEVFWHSHDPTTLNRQGADTGTQYRSVIFYHNEEQKQEAERSKEAAGQPGRFSGPIVTEIVPFMKFYPAENYHQDFFDNNPSHPYCSYNIAPKVKKMKSLYGDKLKLK